MALEQAERGHPLGGGMRLAPSHAVPRSVSCPSFFPQPPGSYLEMAQGGGRNVGRSQTGGDVGRGLESWVAVDRLGDRRGFRIHGLAAVISYGAVFVWNSRSSYLCRLAHSSLACKHARIHRDVKD